MTGARGPGASRPSGDSPLTAGRLVAGENLLPGDGQVTYHPGFLSTDEAAATHEALEEAIPFEQEHCRIAGVVHPLPRLTAWYGEVTYRYSGVTHPPRAFPPVLDELRARVAARVGGGYWPTSVLLNCYRDGTDTVGWHADDEAVFGPEPVIASVSLGAARRFLLRRKDDHRQRVALVLEHGSLLLMAGCTQRHWQHSVPRSLRGEGAVGPRLNLTFRGAQVGR